PGVYRFEAASGGGTDDFYATDGPSRNVDKIASGEDGGFAIERAFDDAGDDRVAPFAALLVGCEHPAPLQCGSGYLVSVVLDLAAQAGLGHGTLAARIPAFDAHDREHVHRGLRVPPEGRA